jgi:ribosomal protein S12 methylthiotransferase accessory factor
MITSDIFVYAHVAKQVLIRAFYKEIEDLNMEILIGFPGGSRVDAHFGKFTVLTDQPPAASTPTPFELFLSSIGTCAGIYVLGFCQQRGLSTEGIQIVQHIHSDPLTHMVDQIDLDIVIPPGFPEKYRDSLVRSAELCKVKKHLEQPPGFRITTRIAETRPMN